MSLRARCAGLTTTVALLAAAAALAADPPGNRPGRGSLGGAAGAGLMLADADYSEGSGGRLWFSGHFRYVMTPSWRLQFTPAFTWTGYDDTPAPFVDLNFPADLTKAEYLALVAPASAQLQWTILGGQWLYHIGAGGGAYRVWVENRRKVVEDPVTHVLHRGIYPGVSGEVGLAYFLKEHPNISLELASGGDWIFALREEQFPSGYDSFLLPFHVRFGANYYFDVGRPAPKSTPPGVPSR